MNVNKCNKKHLDFALRISDMILLVYNCFSFDFERRFIGEIAVITVTPRQFSELDEEFL